MILWAWVSASTCTAQQRALPDRVALMTGQIGRPGNRAASAARPEQRQGASDAA